MILVPMIAVLDRCWLRATMIEARSQRGKSGEQKKLLLLLLELLGFGVGFAGAIVCFVARASPLQAAFQIMRLREKIQERMPEGCWQVLGCTG